MQTTTDILIIGGGLAGLQAAVRATRENPAFKIIIADLGGGASSEVMGFCAPLASGDSAEIFAQDTIKSGGGENDPALVKCLADNALAAVREAEALGIDFDHDEKGNYDLLQPAGSSFPRVVHHKTVTGKAIIARHQETLSQNPNFEYRSIRIVKLFTQNGQICGAFGFENEEPVIINTNTVVIATGGAAGLFGFSSWTKMLRGSGYALAKDAGAELTGMNRVQFEPCVTVHPQKMHGFPIITTLLFEGARLLNNEGNSLLAKGEAVPPKGELVRRIAATIENGKACAHGGVMFDFRNINEDTFEKKYPEYYRKLRPLCDSLENLQIEVKPAAHTTLGGIKVNVNCEASVNGLFAAGEATGGIHGRDRIGGNAGLEVLVFGNIAGKEAAQYASKQRDQHCDCTSSASTYQKELGATTGNASISDYMNELGNILDDNCGFIRTEKSLAKGRELLDKLRREFKTAPTTSARDTAACCEAFTVAELLLS